MTRVPRGRRVLISGGTSGIGEAVATRLAATDSVWILGSRPATVSSALTRTGAAGGSSCDIADEAGVETAIGEAANALGGLDAVFVNAGIDGEAKPAVELDVERFRRLLDINVVGTYLVARAAERVLTRPGAMVLNASINALRPERNFLDYNASKAAVVSIAQTLALELSASRVSVIAMCPGYFPTRMTSRYLDDEHTCAELRARIPAGRFGSLDELAAVADFLLSPVAAYLTGGVISIDGGASL